ncbi:MAG: TPM domain-containing protein [Novosphingobium sp.]
MLALLALAGILLFAVISHAQTFPALTGRVVDGANIIPVDEVARLDQKLAALEQQSHRQLVVVTVPDLQGYEISDYGYRLGRAWGIGEKTTNNGAILLIAPKEHKVRVEVGYGLEGIITDGLSALIIQREIVPRFKAGDMPGGIEAGTDALIKQLALPEDEARKIAAQAKPAPAKSNEIFPALMWLGFIFLFILLPILRRARGGARYQSSGLGPIMLWSVLDGMSRGGGGGGGNWGGGGGGFSGGGGSFGGGGASGSW